MQHCVGGYHAGPGVALGRAERGTGAEMAAYVETTSALFGEASGILTGQEYFREDILKLPAEAARSDEFVELGYHRGVVLLRGRIYGNHTRGVAYAEHFLAGELPVDVAGKRGEEVDFAHMLLAVEDSLIEMADAPAQGDIVDE